MRAKILGIVFLFVLCLPPVQAKADVNLILSSRHTSHGRHRDRHWFHDRRSFRPAHHRPDFWFYMPPPRRIVYTTTVVNPVVLQAESAPLAAYPASETFIDAQGRQCREYQTTGWLNGTQQVLYGTACLCGDGAWRTVN